MVAPTDLAAAVLLVGISIAGAFDLRTREVPDNLWRVLGIVGAAIGVLTISTAGALLPIVLWIVVAVYALQYFFPWTDRLARRFPRAETAVEVALALSVVLGVGTSAAVVGVGAAAVPYAIIVTLAVTLAARGLYETRVLSGGADAKALIAIALVVPLFPASVLDFGPASAAFLQVVPFAFNALVDAALLTLVVPLALAVRNLRAREFRWRDGFTSYSLPIVLVPRRYVWVEEPTGVAQDETRDEGTSEEDLARRHLQLEELRKRGQSRVRVSPQVPFVLFLALGSIVTVVAGNLLWDLFVSL